MAREVHFPVFIIVRVWGVIVRNGSSTESAIICLKIETGAPDGKFPLVMANQYSANSDFHPQKGNPMARRFHGFSAMAALFAVLALASAMLLACAGAARAQAVDFQKERQPLVEIHDLWRFHTGDDPGGKLGWADPGFDDSGWKLLRSDQPLAAQGYAGYSGMAWYRFRVLLPANHSAMAIHIPEIGTSYQVFAGGQLIGQFGGLPPHERVYWSPDGWASQTPALGQIIPIPTGDADGNGALVIAIRVWQWRDWASVYKPVFEAFSIGDASLINDLRQQKWNYEFWSLSSRNAQLLVYLLAALAGLGLFLLRSGEGEYLWFAAFEMFSAAICALKIYPAFHPSWFQGFEALEGVLTFLWGLCLSMFFMTLLKEHRGRLFWSMICSAILVPLMFVPVVMQWMNAVVWIPVVYLSFLPFIACQLLLLTLAARRGNLDARLLLGPFGLQYGAILGGGLLFGMQAFGLGGSSIAFLAEKWDKLFRLPFPISVEDVADFFCQVSILAILVLRFARTRRDEERMVSELESARVVQQVLVPADIPAIPGVHIESVYKPAGQVGGDFFQIIPTKDGGVLVAIGDVSGKGMPAAMTVSLLVGTLRTLAHYSQSPGEILAAMNQRMLARSHGGFTTCLVLRCDADGRLTIANAGHIAPYLVGKELPLENGLPLGLAAESAYAESTFQLRTGEQLTLLTDGVVEARDKAGDLFGFERSAALSTQPAEAIANAAVAFGQDDDITALTLSYAGVPTTA
jgi:Stage II sporulation protein E (SpoIIE)